MRTGFEPLTKRQHVMAGIVPAGQPKVNGQMADEVRQIGAVTPGGALSQGPCGGEFHTAANFLRRLWSVS